jgi:hypothetical protein
MLWILLRGVQFCTFSTYNYSAGNYLTLQLFSGQLFNSTTIQLYNHSAVNYSTQQLFNSTTFQLFNYISKELQPCISLIQYIFQIWSRNDIWKSLKMYRWTDKEFNRRIHWTDVNWIASRRIKFAKLLTLKVWFDLFILSTFRKILNSCNVIQAA